jgi:hypothetical protein
MYSFNIGSKGLVVHQNNYPLQEELNRGDLFNFEIECTHSTLGPEVYKSFGIIGCFILSELLKSNTIVKDLTLDSKILE